jgi:hypothetical protein
MDLNETYAKIESLLDLEEKLKTGESIKAHEDRRKEIMQSLTPLSTSISRLTQRLHRLPDLPPAYLITWAQAVLKFANLAFVVLDTTGVDDNSDIIRVFIANRAGRCDFDYLVRPQRQQYANTTYTGIAQEELDTFPSLSDIWPVIQSALAGRYVLAYNLPFVKARLDDNADHYGLPKITIIGEDLQEQARLYWTTRYYPPKLVDICHRIGHQLPRPATAPDRVAGHVALLTAMSQGIINVSQPEPESEEDEGIF